MFVYQATKRRTTSQEFEEPKSGYTTRNPEKSKKLSHFIF
jgi:hypothetical protein